MAKKSGKKTSRASKKTSTVIARRKRQAPVPSGALVRVNDPQGLLQPLQDQPVLGAFALVEVKLTKAEEKVLARPVDKTNVLIRPDGKPYLPHKAYRDWFHEAFGRLGWQLRPTNNPVLAPAKNENAVQVVRGYMLFVHGKPVAYADGEHEFYKNNPEQSYGDAVEATQASALRRCAKHIGVGLELWDKNWLDAFKREHCICYRVRVRDRRGNTTVRDHWALKTDTPPRNMVGAGDVDDSNVVHGEIVDEEPRRRAPAAAGSDGGGALKITVQQSKRLFAIAKSADRDWREVLRWLKARFGAEEVDTQEGKRVMLKRADYAFVCEAVGAPGPLPSTREAAE